VNHLIKPHGGELSNLIVDEDRKNALKDLCLHIPFHFIIRTPVVRSVPPSLLIGFHEGRSVR